MSDDHPCLPLRTEGLRSGAREARPRSDRPVRLAAFLTIPYLLLGIVWAASNPPGAAPDESDHLIKALAAGRLDIGEEYVGPPRGPGPIGRRNASISRIVEIPARLEPVGYECTAFQPAKSASCQPGAPQRREGTVRAVTTVGAYPVFGYIPLGLAANAAATPGGAFLAARLASLVMAATLLFAGAWHLTRWLGRWANLGLVIAVTPMSVFASSSVSTSGLEIMSATALACVAVVATRCPESLRDARTIALMGVAGSALVLSRQMGVVALAVLGLLVLVRGGGRIIADELRHRRASMLVAGASISVACVVLLSWERAFDHPSDTGVVLSGGALHAYFDQLYHYVASGVGEFGWLDTPLPGVAIGTWVVLATGVIALAAIAASRPDRWTLVLVLGAIAVIAYITHATVFYPIGAGLQGRHLLPVFSILPILAGVNVVELFASSRRNDVIRRLFLATGTVMGGLQLLAVLVNARRYAVGSAGPVFFFDDAAWSPRLGWAPWCLMALAASGALTVVISQSWPREGLDVQPKEATDVER